MIDIKIKDIKKIPMFKDIGEELGECGSGIVFRLGNKAIKIARPYFSIKEDLKTLEYFKNNRFKAVAKIYDYGTVKIKNKTYIWNTSEILNDVSYTIENQLPYLGIHLNSKYIKKYSNSKFKKLQVFAKDVKKIPYKYTDFFCCNVMENKHGTLKLIDIVSFKSKKKK